MAISLAAMALGCAESPRVPSQLANPADVISITLETTEPGSKKKVVVDDPAAMKALLSLAVFTTKPPCGCAHYESVVFGTKQGSTTASICDHCFDLVLGSSYANYEMTPAFHAKFLELMNGDHAAKDR